MNPKLGVSPFVGPSGDDWCCQPAMTGAPDTVTDKVLQWLIVPGPPVSAYFTYCLPREDPSDMQFYHMHPETWSVHVVCSGNGEYAAEGQKFSVSAGSVIYHGPRVRHSIYPRPNEHLAFVVVQHPSIGWTDREHVVCPEAGTVEHFNDPQAFIAKFGSAQSIKDLQQTFFQSSRWQTFTKPR
jgi:mannose-6-phosphate isomerase-like protein (cupin superfamily)